MGFTGICRIGQDDIGRDLLARLGIAYLYTHKLCLV